MRRLGVGALAVAGLLLSLNTQGTAQSSDEVFNPNVVQRVDLRINARDWEELKANFLEDRYYLCDFVMLGQTVRSAGIRSRGGGSRSSVKPGLRVDFNRYVTNQTFAGVGSVILDNNNQDFSGMREPIAMRFHQRMGLPFHREGYVRLYVNDEYLGLYLIVESVDKSFLRRTFGEVDGNVQNDGHLFEYKWRYEWFFTHLGSALAPYVEIWESKDHENQSVETKYRPLETFIRLVNQSSDADFVSAVTPYMDLKLAMKQLAVSSFLAEWDGIVGYAGVNNSYLYRFEKTTRHQFIGKDMDNTFKAIDFPILEGIDRNVLARRAMAVPELRNVFLDTLLASAEAAGGSGAPPSPGAPPAMFKRPRNLITGALDGPVTNGWLEAQVFHDYPVFREALREDTKKPYSNEQFESDVEYLANFARQRASFVVSEVRKVPR